MIAVGDTPQDLVSMDASRLEMLLDLYQSPAETSLPRAVAMSVAAIGRANAFLRGNRRTALVAAAFLLERHGLLQPADWSGFAAELEFVHGGRSLRTDTGNLTTWLETNVEGHTG
jgi:hypothetical protein